MPDNASGYALICVVANYGTGSRIIKAAKACGITGGTIFFGKGTAGNAIEVAESVEVLRCAGLRPDDLVTPVDADVTLPPGTVPVPLVRHHKRPWSGTGEAPGSTSDAVIDEHEVLGYASVAIPHLAEIWRLHADGREEYVSTYNQRNGQWLGDTTPSHQCWRPSG